MIDAILYVASMPALVAELDATHPNKLQRDETGAITTPPVIVDFANASRATNGDASQFYARLNEADAAFYRTLSGVEVLAEAEYTGKSTAERVYQQVFDDPDALAKFEGVWQRTRTVTDPDTGETREVRQDKFGHPAEESRSWYTPPVPLAERLATAQAAKIKQINAAYTAAAEPLINEYPEVEQQSWLAQEAEARAYLEWRQAPQGDAPPTRLLDNILQGRNGETGTETLEQLSLAVVSNADLFTQFQLLTGKRQRLVKQARAAETVEVVEGIGWETDHATT